MKKVLYIYGYGSNENSGTRQSLQNVLGSNYKVESIYYEQLQPNEAIEYLSNYACEECEDSYEIVFLTATNTLNYTGIHIKGLTASEFEAEYKLMRKMKGNELIDNNREAEIENRKHA